ncbi:hypothetical protein D1816_00890 [Aquimarina sp. AD10]|uniref:tetratricopeptide repeat-containing sensor histidine kinase n=1 Tax=Aquimarina sp. AD10 TaxID=1714849 RepID=UPI000E4F508F|nr:tetratricopeptide repeat-containing sensor histidine kinase [Aquimarina sp. AD10]AXT58966.1 hypothetical protein D1816_00890 [Aquimarina sp. AD10]RKM99558.1 hypothetical protein D7033_10320 [Aquimarina sp. AD10]
MTYQFFIKLFFFALVFSMVSCNKTIENNKRSSEQKEAIDIYIKKAKNKPKSHRLVDINTAMKLSKKLKNEEETKEVLSVISLEYYYMKEYDLFKDASLDMLQLSVKSRDSIRLAKAYSNLGSYYNRKNTPDSAYYNFNKAITIYKMLDKKYELDLNSTKFFGAALFNRALIKHQFKDFNGGEAGLVQAIEQFEKIKANLYLFFCYNNLGIISKDLGKSNEALENYQKALGYAKKINNNKYSEIQTLNNIGVVYKNQKRYKLAIKTFEEALNHKIILKEKPHTEATLIDNMAYAKFLSGERKDILKSFLKALKIRDSVNEKSDLITNNIHIAEYYKSINQDSTAIKYAKEAKRIAELTGSIKELLKSLLFLKDFEGNKESLDFANTYIKLNDSLQNEERISKDKFARIRFETDQKEQQIIEVQNQNTIYLLGMLLLLSGIGFAIYFFRQRTQHLAQQNKMVQFQASYETETRISKRLHDELGNDIFQVMLQYQNDPHDPQIKEKLNTSYLKARDISRENNEFETDETFSEELNNMLHNYTQNGIQLMARGLDRIDWDHISKPIKITVYRVLQELMTNMQKHSKAKLVVLIFSNIDNILRIKYSDNGVGVTKEHLQSKNGLRNTEKRIQAIQGTLIFESEKDKGFKAEIKIPN